MDDNTTHVFVNNLSDPLRVLHGSAVILACILGVAGNLLVVISIASTPKLRTSHNAFVFNLSVVDLLLSVFSLPLYATGILAQGWPLGPSFCRLKVHLSLILWQVSMSTLAAVATNRQILVAKSAETYSRFCGIKQIALILFSFWFLSLLMFLIAEFIIEVDAIYLSEFSSCALNPWHTSTHVYAACLISVSVMTVMTVLPVQYLRVLLAVRASRRRVGRAALSKRSSAGQPQLPRQDPRGPTGVNKEEIKLIKMFFLLTLVYVISYFPLSIVYIFGVTFPVFFHGARFGMFILSITSAINPILYAWMNREIRKACYRLFRCKLLATTSPRLERGLDQA